MKNVTLAIPEDLLNKAREYAKKNGTSLNEMIRELLRKNVTVEEADFAKKLKYFQKKISIKEPIEFNRDEIYDR